MSIKARPIKANVKLNNNYNNAIHFLNDNEKINYFNSIEDNFYEYLDAQPEVNFNIGNTLTTSIKIDLNNIATTLNQALQYNYLVVKDTSFSKQYYYYFITGATPINQNVVGYNLELDVITTYNLNSDYTIDNVLVERAHVDRFTESSTKESFTFDLSKNSKSQAPEDLEQSFNKTYPKQIVDLRINENLCGLDVNREIYNEFKKINGWLVAFVSGGTTDIFKDDDIEFFSYNATLILPYKIYIAPMLKIKVKKEDSYYEWSANDLYERFKEGTETEEVYGFSVLKECPIENYILGRDSFAQLFSIDSEKNLVFNYDSYKGLFEPIPGIITKLAQFSFNFDSDNVLVMFSDIIEPKQIKKNSYTVDLGLQKSFLSASKDDLKDINKEPKLLKSPFTKIILKDNNNEGYTFSVFDLCDTSISRSKIKSLEFPNPESIKSFVTIDTDNSFTSNFYNEKVGFISTNTFNLPVIDDAYLSYIRQNKNSAITGLAIPAVTAGLGLAVGVATGGLGLVAGAGAVIKQGANVANYFANIDNLKNTPDGIKNSGNDFLHSFVQGTIKSYISIEELRDFEKETVYNYLYKYGYRVQRRMNSDELFTRYIFNYIKVMENIKDKITTNNNIILSNTIKDKISEIFENGVTLWEARTDKIFNFSYENYEKRLVEGDNND